MIETPKTDRVKSSSAEEFIWDTAGHTEIHNYIIKPIINALQSSDSKTVLDLGCGNGSFSALLSSEGFEVTGIDHSLSGIEIAQQNSLHLTFKQHDILKPLPGKFDSAFDAIVTVEVIEHLLLPRKLMDNAVFALKPGGKLILTTPFHGYLKNLTIALTGKFDDHWHPLRDYGHIKFFSKATILELFNEYGLKNITFQTVGRIPALARSMIITAEKPL